MKKQENQEPTPWATNVRARIHAIDVLQPELITPAEREMYNILTREYAKVGADYSLEQAKERLKDPFWKKVFEAYSIQCNRVEQLLIMMLQSNAPLSEGMIVTIKPKEPGAQDWEGYITEFRATLVESTRHVMLEVFLQEEDSPRLTYPIARQIDGDLGM